MIQKLAKTALPYSWRWELMGQFLQIFGSLYFVKYVLKKRDFMQRTAGFYFREKCQYTMRLQSTYYILFHKFLRDHIWSLNKLICLTLFWTSCVFLFHFFDLRRRLFRFHNTSNSILLAEALLKMIFNQFIKTCYIGRLQIL